MLGLCAPRAPALAASDRGCAAPGARSTAWAAAAAGAAAAAAGAWHA